MSYMCLLSIFLNFSSSWETISMSESNLACIFVNASIDSCPVVSSFYFFDPEVVFSVTWSVALKSEGFLRLIM
jgi:hypothetical protein